MKSPRALVVAPDSPVRKTILRALSMLKGLEIVCASSPLTAISYFTFEAPFALALVEYRSPDMDGLEFLKRVRCGRTHAPRSLPLGVVIDFASQHHLNAAMALDLNVLLLMPLSHQEVMNRSRKLLGLSFEPKAVELYERVGIPEPPTTETADRATDRSPVSVLRPLAPVVTAGASDGVARPSGVADAPAFGPMFRRTVPELQLGWQIVDNVVGPTGTRLIGAGTVLNARLLARLRDLDAESCLGSIKVRAPL